MNFLIKTGAFSLVGNYLRPSNKKTGAFSLVGNYLRPSNNYRQVSFNINAVVLILIICKDLRNW